MPLLETLDADLKSAMKAQDAEKLSCLRLVKSAMTSFMIEKKKNTLADAEAIEILQRQVKQRRESYDSFSKAGRTDLADKEKREIAILEHYLPKQLSDDEIKALATEAIASSQAKTAADTGKVMQKLMPLVKGKADGKRVNDIVLALLNS